MFDMNGKMVLLIALVVFECICSSALSDIIFNPFSQLSSVQEPLPTKAIKIAAGSYHTAVLASSGTIWTWGSNYYGQLGDGTTVDKLVPVSVTGLAPVMLVANGEYQTSAITYDGSLWTCGQNNYGQLGDGTNIDRATPVQSLNLSGIVSFDGGDWHSIALKSDGTVDLGK